MMFSVVLTFQSYVSIETISEKDYSLNLLMKRTLVQRRKAHSASDEYEEVEHVNTGRDCFYCEALIRGRWKFVTQQAWHLKGKMM